MFNLQNGGQPFNFLFKHLIIWQITKTRWLSLRTLMPYLSRIIDGHTCKILKITAQKIDLNGCRGLSHYWMQRRKGDRPTILNLIVSATCQRIHVKFNQRNQRLAGRLHISEI